MSDEQDTTREAILSFVTEILAEVAADWDVGPILPETQLGELGLESISLVYLIGEIQQRYHLQDRLFQSLRAAEINIAKMRIADIVDFVCDILSNPRANVAGGEL